MNIKLKNEKEWSIKEYDEKAVALLTEELGIDPFLARLLAVRGFDDPLKAEDFLSADEYLFHNPFLLNDMEKAVDRINKALEQGERILIYGDYDVDGISSVSALYLYLASRGGKACYYIPERLSEGYGLNESAIDKFAKAGISLIITVDTGITAVKEAEYIKEKGMDIIITDHHECPEILPEKACAIINPKRGDSTYPFSELAGVGVVFKLICALAGSENIIDICNNYLDIVCLGTISDVMPLYGENRRIVTKGLSVINENPKKHIGISALLDAAVPESVPGTRKVSASTVGFAIAPRLNAAGRIGDVKRAAELLITNDENSATLIAEELCALNRERQSIENKILTEAIEKISTEIDLENDKVIVLADENWHQGVIGIVASRITEKYGLPSVLITFSGDIGKGSARSIPGFNINEAIGSCSDYIIKSGGHELAAGLSLEKKDFDSFKKAVNEYASGIITDEMRVMHLLADCELSENEIDISHAQMLYSLEPYGSGNPSPVFILREALVDTITPIGMNKHLKLTLKKNNKLFTALYFNKTPEEFKFMAGQTADVAFNLEINEYRGQRNVQLNVRDMKMSGETAAYINRQAKDYLRAIASFVIAKENLPDMQALRSAFIYLRSALKTTDEIDILKTAHNISCDFSINITPCMLNIILDVFTEMGLADVKRDTLNDVSVTLTSVSGKVNIESSKLLTKLRSSAI
ncbi:MAG: single-stranded-DNA-specific exonuclease RecJ [Ruminococcaceae bacterium]|nr:single-stranded-DNA-specific exonuclease RecJ [Oscillospiraceae bacterium]